MLCFVLLSQVGQEKISRWTENSALMEFFFYKSLGLLMETKHMYLALHFHIFSIWGWFNHKMVLWILTVNQFILQNKLQHSIFLNIV